MIKRNCSASPGQLALVFGSLVAVSFVFGAVFAAFGFWLVLPFVGIELIAVAAAFVCYGRNAADYEQIDVRAGAVMVRQTRGSATSQWQLDPRSSIVQVESHRRRWGKEVKVFLQAPGLKLELARDLLDERRRQFARELDLALMRARLAQ